MSEDKPYTPREYFAKTVKALVELSNESIDLLDGQDMTKRYGLDPKDIYEKIISSYVILQGLEFIVQKGSRQQKRISDILPTIRIKKLSLTAQDFTCDVWISDNRYQLISYFSDFLKLENNQEPQYESSDEHLALARSDSNF